MLYSQKDLKGRTGILSSWAVLPWFPVRGTPRVANACRRDHKQLPVARRAVPRSATATTPAPLPLHCTVCTAPQSRSRACMHTGTVPPPGPSTSMAFRTAKATTSHTNRCSPEGAPASQTCSLRMPCPAGRPACSPPPPPPPPAPVTQRTPTVGQLVGVGAHAFPSGQCRC